MSYSPPQNTFIVRFWWEMRGKDPTAIRCWRGRIDHAQSGDSIAFIDAKEMLAFMERFVAPLEAQSAENKEEA